MDPDSGEGTGLASSATPPTTCALADDDSIPGPQFHLYRHISRPRNQHRVRSFADVPRMRRGESLQSKSMRPRESRMNISRKVDLASSTGQCNASWSLSAGVLNPKVLRGRVLS